MTLLRSRARKSSSYGDVGTDIENTPGPSFSTLSSTSTSTSRSSTSSTSLSSSLYATKANSLGSFLTWVMLTLRRIWRQRRTKTIGTNGSTYCYGISPLRLLIFVKIFFVVVTVTIVSTALHFAPPGKNYLDQNYWRRSHSLSSQQIRDLRDRFPVRVDTNNADEMESIVHPGYLLADKERMRALLKEEFRAINMTVPKFWDPVDAFGEYDGGVKEFLGNRGKYLITPTEASAIGSFYDDKQTIFLAIASYRDPECSLTVESVFARAKHPERIRLAIIDQRREGDPSCRPPSENLCRTSPDNSLCEFIGQIDYIEYPSDLMVGPVFARHLANRMYRGEYFAMQVDSHVRFVANWDEDLIHQWTSTGNEMAVISTYMTDIGRRNINPKTHEAVVFVRSIMCDFKYEWNPGPNAHIKFNIQPSNVPKVRDSPMLHPFWAAGFSFGRGHFLVSVPYDHYLPFVFQGEEILQTIRGFSFGYDFYAPSRNVAFHIYAMGTNIEKRKNIPKFTENQVIYGPEVKTQAYQRLIGISGTSDSARDFLHLEEERYGLGRIRSREQFFEIFGIHPSTNTIEENLCQFVQGSPIPGAPGSMHVKFKPFLRYDKMGIDYSRITYRHKTHITKIDEKELAIGQARLLEMMAKQHTNTSLS